MANIPIGTVTFLFTDIEGSASMWEKYLAQANGGYVFKTVGDAYCAAFTTAKQAFFVQEWDKSTIGTDKHRAELTDTLEGLV